MSKRFLLKDTGCPTPSTSSKSQPANKINWALCVICQEDRKEKLTDPTLTKRKDAGSAYTSLAESLLRLNELPGDIQIEILDEGNGLEAALVDNKAQWHQSCRLAFNKNEVQRAEKRALKKSSSTGDDDTIAVPSKQRRGRSSTENPTQEALYFFCCKPAGTDGLHEAATFHLDKQVRTCAELLQDTELLARLSAGDMIALESKYHNKCLVGLYNRVRKHKTQEKQGTDEEKMLSGIAFAEVVMYIEESRFDDSTAPVFKLADLSDLYRSRMEQLGIKLESKVNTTRLKERLLAQIPDLQAQPQGRDVLLAFSDDIGAALTKACEWDSDSDAVYLGRAANIVRRHMFELKPFTGFHEGCQRDSVLKLLLALVNMVLEGPSIRDQSAYPAKSAAFTIAQLLRFNSVKHRRLEGSTSVNVRHNATQETPVPMYIGLMVHAQTRKREVVERLSHLGVSITYDRVLRLSAQLGESVIQQYHKDQVVCPPKMRGGVFTTAAVDNIDHNPSSTTSKESFHGTVPLESLWGRGENVMARGRQKIQSQQKSAKKQADKKKQQCHDQKTAAMAALVHTCTVCKVASLESVVKPAHRDLPDAGKSQVSTSSELDDLKIMVLDNEPDLHEMTTVCHLNMEGKASEEAALMEGHGCCQGNTEHREASFHDVSDHNKLGSIHQPEGSSHSQHQQMFGKLFQGAESNNPLLNLAYASCERPVGVPASSGAQNLHLSD
uniref:uncharacterized protein isoform X2 n=1 Tax=Myxine glutinosa TaxID=7769 RepID=UPI00358FEB60